MINEDETAEILEEAAGYDNRTVGIVDIDRWLKAAQRSETTHGVPWTLATALAAVQDYYSGPEPGFLKPGDITGRIKNIREQLRKGLTAIEYRAPAELADDPAAERAWSRNAIEEHMRLALDAWAMTGTIAQTPAAAAAIAELVTERLALTAAPEVSDAA